jgi:protein disulfide-isomerase A1
MLADGDPPIRVAKINADKYRSAVAKYDISFYPTLKFFANGYPTDYDGPHSAQALITHVRRLTAPPIEVYTSESRFRDFLSSRGSDLPIFVGFGLEASSLEKLAHKYRNKGWFAVLREYSENAHEDFRFDERHAVVVLRGDDEVQDVYYGPFEGPELASFVKRNLLALVTPLNPDSLKVLTGDGRPTVVTILDSYSSAEADAVLKKVKIAAQTNRDFVFSSMVAAEWPKFVRPFALGKKPMLPTVIIWDKQMYAKSDKADAFVGDKVETSLSELLQGYRENTIKRHTVKGPTLYEKATENTTQLLQALALIGALFFQWFRKNKEQGAVLRQETETPETAGTQPSGDGSSSAPASRGVADTHKED